MAGERMRRRGRAGRRGSPPGSRGTGTGPHPAHSTGLSNTLNFYHTGGSHTPYHTTGECTLLPLSWQSYSLSHNWRRYSFLSLHWFLDATLTVGSIVGKKHIWHQHSYRSVGSHTHNPIIGSKQYQ